MRWLRGALVLQLRFFAGWGGILLTSHRGAHEVWLATDPVDPRDWLGGHYVALRFRQLDAPQGPGCDAVGAAGMIYLRLEPGPSLLATVEGKKTAWRVAGCAADVPPSAGKETWIRGRRDGQRGRFLFGIERFYVPETSELRTVRSGEVVARVAVNRKRQARILELVRIP